MAPLNGPNNNSEGGAIVDIATHFVDMFVGLDEVDTEFAQWRLCRVSELRHVGHGDSVMRRRRPRMRVQRLRLDRVRHDHARRLIVVGLLRLRSAVGQSGGGRRRQHVVVVQVVRGSQQVVRQRRRRRLNVVQMGAVGRVDCRRR